MKTLRALLAEDEALLALEVKDRLTEAGFDVVGPYATVAEAKERARFEELHLAVVDMLLRDDSAVALIEGLRRRCIPLVIISGLAAPHDSRYEGAEWLTKPVAPDDLLRAVDRALGRVPQRPQS